METVSRCELGTSMPTTDFPGIGATMRKLIAFMANARSSARFTILATLVPGAGSNSYIVTTGPGRTSVTLPSMPKLSNAFDKMSDCPFNSSSVMRASIPEGSVNNSSASGN